MNRLGGCHDKIHFYRLEIPCSTLRNLKGWADSGSWFCLLLYYTLQFTTSRKTSSGPPTGMIAWADMTKFGRMDTKQLNFATSVVGAVLGKHPTTSIGIILAPHLVSEKVSGGHRGEIRFLDPHPLAPFNFFCKARVSPSVLCLCRARIALFWLVSILRRVEDKLDSRRLASQLITLRMEAPPSSKRVAMNMFGWIVWNEDSISENIFRNCELMQLRRGFVFNRYHCLL